MLGWFVLYEGLNKLIWENGFVTDNAWMFPVICLPFSLLVGLLVKYAKAPSNLDGSILDSLTGDVMHLKWRDLPATVATSLASLFSGAVLGPEGAIGNIASKIAALYCDLLRIPADRRPKLVFASVSSGYNGLLENPIFAAVLGTEVAETKQQGLSTLPASLIGGAVGYGIFLVLGEVGFLGFLHLPPGGELRLVVRAAHDPAGAGRPASSRCSPRSSCARPRASSGGSRSVWCCGRCSPARSSAWSASSRPS